MWMLYQYAWISLSIFRPIEAFPQQQVTVDNIYSPLGMSLGKKEGSKLGTSEGSSDGTEPDGTIEGLKDGTSLGTDDGWKLGWSEGTSVDMEAKQSKAKQSKETSELVKVSKTKSI